MIAVTPFQLFEQGKVQEATSALASLLRDRPSDTKNRTFLFELLCFAGQYDRAEKHLNILAEGSSEREMGAVLYLSALHAEKSRHDLFRTQQFPDSPATPSPRGTLNGRPFESISDADPQIGARLELYAAGAYLWIPFRHIASVHINPPRLLRDTLWTSAFVLTGPEFKGTDIGQVIIPAVYPFSWKAPDETLWLGRGTDWMADGDGEEYPVGHKLFLVDGAEVPLAEIRSLEFSQDAAA